MNGVVTLKHRLGILIALTTFVGFSPTLCTMNQASVAHVGWSNQHQVPVSERNRVAQVLLNYLKQSTREQALSGFQDLENQTKLSASHRVAFRSFASAPAVLLVDAGAGYSPHFDVHLIFWETSGEWKHQEMPEFPDTYQAMQARVSVSPSGTPEVGAFYNASQGSGSPVPVFVLFRMAQNRWEVAWRTPVLPLTFDHGDAWFIGNGISRFAMEYDSWLTKDPREHIFNECHPCLHRRYRYVWKRASEASYTLEQFGPIASPYNTLTDFVYLLGVGRTQEAARLTTEPSLLKKALALGLKKGPGTPGWLLQYNFADATRGPYRITSGPAIGTEITFIRKDGRVLISDIQGD